MSEDILTIREVAEYLKVTEKTVYGLAQKGKIPGFKVGGQWRFKREDIDQWIEDGKEAATGRQGDEA
ncbi:MAG: DNA-binding protein [Proteobacteria bacterium]|nr:MAG: DNA-binding protein [Pseudomonadota bacterium]